MITFAFWKINPKYVREYHDKRGFSEGNTINISLAKKIVDTLIPMNSISEIDSALALKKELEKLEEPENKTFLDALIYDDYEAIKMLITNQRVSKPFVLLSAAAFNAINTVKLMLINEPDLNASDPEGWTPLLVACTHNTANVARLLNDAGADINRKSKFGTTPLMLTAANGNYNLVQLLIEKGAHVNELMFDYSALRLAADQNRTDIVELLRNAGAQS